MKSGPTLETHALQADPHPGHVGIDVDDQAVTSDLVEELRAFVAEQDRIAARKRAERRSQMRLPARLLDHIRTMKWQDAVFSAGEVVFMVGLIPTLLGPGKPSPITSVSTGVMILGFLFAHASFKLWTAFCLAAVTATMWFVIAAQTIFA